MLSPEVWAQFPALRLVDMTGCGITTWSNMTLASKLTHFFLQNNKIMGIPSEHGLPPDNILQALYI